MRIFKMIIRKKTALIFYQIRLLGQENLCVDIAAGLKVREQ